MREHRELFRIFVNSVRFPRDMAEELRLINDLVRTIELVLAPKTIRNRLHYFLDQDRQTDMQWLIVTCSDSLQRQLFGKGATVALAPVEQDYLAESTIAEVADALKRLQQLSHKARWNPDDFMETVHASPTPGIGLLTSRDDDLTLKTNHGKTITAQAIHLPRRTQLTTAVGLDFRIDMLGRNKASIEPVRPQRSSLRMHRRHAMLYWHALEQPTVYDKLRHRLESSQLIQAEVYPLVDKHGQATDFALAQLP